MHTYLPGCMALGIMHPMYASERFLISDTVGDFLEKGNPLNQEQKENAYATHVVSHNVAFTYVLISSQEATCIIFRI